MNKSTTVYKPIRAITSALLMLLVVVACLFTPITTVNAAAALTVKLNGEVQKTYTVAALKKLSNGKQYNYSAWNTFPTFSVAKNESGPTVEAILKDAGVLGKVKDDGTVTFDKDGYKMSLTGKQLLKEKRYYYPNAKLVDPEEGFIPADAYEGKSQVPAIISLKDDGSFCIGQVAPNEENKPLFVHDMLSGGIINVSTSKAKQCDGVVASVKSGGMIKDGEQLALSFKEGSKNSWEYDKIYISLDKNTSPDYGSPIYNCGPKQDLEYRPAVSGNGVVTVKVRVKGYGKLDSTLQTFSYYVGNALTVKLNGQVLKAYETIDDVKKCGSSVTVSYSGYNTYPTLSFKENVSGVSVKDILKNAGFSDFGKSGTITFTTGADKYSTTFTLDELLGTTRYYYPNAAAGTNNKGAMVTEAAYEGKKEVPVIIETTGSYNLEFGQIAPNEQNFAECVDNMLTLGVIEIDTQKAIEKCAPVGASDPVSGGTVETGKAIKLPYPNKENKRVRIHYIIDPQKGELPSEGSAIYNYSPNRWSENLVNAPKFTTTGTHTIVARNISYGKLDGDVTTYTYNVVLAKPTVTLKAGKKQIKVSWKKVAGADGYTVYRSTKKDSGFKSVKTINNASTVSFVNKNLKAGKTFYYKVRAFENVDGQAVYGKYSAVKSAKVK